MGHVSYILSVLDWRSATEIIYIITVDWKSATGVINIVTVDWVSATAIIDIVTVDWKSATGIINIVTVDWVSATGIIKIVAIDFSPFLRFLSEFSDNADVLWLKCGWNEQILLTPYSKMRPVEPCLEICLMLLRSA